MFERLKSGIWLGATTMLIVVVLVGIRAVLLVLGFNGMASTALSTGIIAGAIFVMGLVVAGTLSDKQAERAPVDIAAGLHALLREGEAMHDKGQARCLDAAAAPHRDRHGAADRHRRGQLAHRSGGRRGAVGDVPRDRVHGRPGELHRPAALGAGGAAQVAAEHLPPATRGVPPFGVHDDRDAHRADLDPAAGHRLRRRRRVPGRGRFLSFFLALLRLLNTISTPFKVGTEHTDDDVSLFLLSEFVVQAQAAAEGEMVVEDVEEAAEEVEEQPVVELEEQAWMRPRPRSARRRSWLRTRAVRPSRDPSRD
jgi:hypothetical protein